MHARLCVLPAETWKAPQAGIVCLAPFAPGNSRLIRLHETRFFHVKIRLHATDMANCTFPTATQVA
jgi:hypothetical protein